MAYLTTTPTDLLAAYGPLVADRVSADFATEPYTRITVAPMTPTIGAEVSGVRVCGDLDEPTRAEIYRALLEWKVLFFRGQVIERAEQRAFAELWGTPEAHPFFKFVQPGQSDVDVTRLAKDAETAGVENNWHNDNTWHREPSKAAVLRAIEVPPVGGDTLWADTNAAYDLLPDDVKERIDPLVAEHDWIQSFGASMSADDIATLRPQFPAAHHPVVRVHPDTGRKGLFVNMIFTQRIVGLPEDESAELLRMLYRHIQRPEFQVRLRWQPNTIAFWDNRACQHYAASDYFPARRVMERISVAGDRPLGIAG
jgi:taurine dioxygenase